VKNKNKFINYWKIKRNLNLNDVYDLNDIKKKSIKKIHTINTDKNNVKFILLKSEKEKLNYLLNDDEKENGDDLLDFIEEEKTGTPRNLIKHFKTNTFFKH
jgi:hypothetical protein